MLKKITRKPNQVPDSLKTIDVKALLRSRGVYNKLIQNKQLKQEAIPIARNILKGKRKQVVSAKPIVNKSLQFSNEVVMSYWEKQIHIVEVVEQHFENKIQQYIKFVEKNFLDNLDSEVTTHKSFVKFMQKDYFSDNEDDLLVQAQIDFAPLLENIATLAGQEANKLIGVNEPYLPFNYRSQIVENVNRFTKSMLDTDRDELINLITNGLQDGQSIPEIRAAITDTFSSFSKMQAQRITRTEVIRASNQAALDAYQQSGVVEGKQWLTAGAVDECADYDGQIESLDGSFYGDTSDFADGDPPLHPNCRCVLVPVVMDSKAYIPANNKKLTERIKELEAQFDKRTKAWREIKEERADDIVYIKTLEKHLGIDDE